MLTIKQVETNGHVGIFEVEHVWVDPKRGVDSPQGNEKAYTTVFAKVPGQEHPLQFCTGDIFVMNANGKTVSDFHLPKQVNDGAGQS